MHSVNMDMDTGCPVFLPSFLGGLRITSLDLSGEMGRCVRSDDDDDDWTNKFTENRLCFSHTSV